MHNLSKAFQISLGITSVFWIIYLADLILPDFQHHIMLIPRTKVGLLTMFSCHFGHGNIGHILNNSLAFLALMTLALVHNKDLAITNSLIIITLTGLFTWLFGRSGTAHIGASGWIMGLFGYLLANARYRKNFISIAVAVLVLIFYSGLFLSLTNFRAGISWEMHIGGFIAGIIASRLTSKQEIEKVEQ